MQVLPPSNYLSIYVITNSVICLSHNVLVWSHMNVIFLFINSHVSSKSRASGF